MQPASGSSSRGGSSTPMKNTLKGPKETTLDIYRPLANQISKPIQPLIPSKSSTAQVSIADLLSLRPSTYTQRVQNKPLHFNPGIQTSTDEAKAVVGRKKNRGDDDARDIARRRAVEKRQDREALEVRTRKKRKRAAVEAGHQIDYERIKPLNHLHTVYLSNLLNLPPFPANGQISAQQPGLNLGGLGGSTDSLHSKISKADFTGAQLSVTSARNASLIGITGSVVEETASTFRLVTLASLIKVIPKNGTQLNIIFPAYGPPLALPLQSTSGEGESYQSTVLPISPTTMEEYMRTTPRISVPLIGTNFGFRSGDRAGRKFRPTQGGGGGSGWGEEYVKGEWSQTLALLGEEDVAETSGASGKGKAGKVKRNILESGVPIKKKRGKSRRKDPPAFGSLETS